MSEVTIALSSGTVAALRSSRSILYALKAGGSSNAAGRPLVWYSTPSYLENNAVSWGPPLSVYIAPRLAGTGPVVPGESAVIAPGQVWRLTGAGNEVFNGGPPGDLSIENSTRTEYACGMSQSVNAGPAAQPLCIFPLTPFALQTITPLDRVVLFFSTNMLPLGSVFEHPWRSTAAGAFARTAGVPTTTFAVVVDTSGDPAGKRSVAYDVAEGWTWDGGNWAHTIAPTGDFVSVLIVKP